RRVHVPVEQAAELDTAHLEGAGMQPSRVGGVVRPLDRVGLDAELDRPEAVGDVERRDVELDDAIYGQLERRRLDAAVARVAERPQPLLPDDLDLQRMRGAGRLG